MHKDSTDGEQVYAEQSNVPDTNPNPTIIPGWSGNGSTLTLSGFDFTTTAAAGLVVPKGTTIVVEGTNQINVRCSGNTCSGIEVSGDGTGNLTFTGSGNLTVKSGVDESNGSHYGIYNEFDNCSIKFEGTGTGTITITAGNTIGDNNVSIGVFSKSAINVSGGKVTATSGRTEGKASSSIGIHAELGEDNAINISGGKVTATAGETTNNEDNNFSWSTGIEASYGKVNISGGEVIATAGSSKYGNIGIFGENDVSISNAKVTAQGADLHGDLSYGIWGLKRVSVFNSDVTAQGANLLSGGMSYGISGVNSVSVSNSDVTATGGTVSGNDAGRSTGIETNEFIFNSGTVNATGSRAILSVGIYGIIVSEGNSPININQAGLTAKGYTVALYSGYERNAPSNNQGANIQEGVYAVGSKYYNGKKAKPYVLDDNDDYKYVATKVKGNSPSEEASDSSADTGDSTNLVLPIGIAIAALLAAAGVTFGRRRYNK